MPVAKVSLSFRTSGKVIVTVCPFELPPRLENYGMTASGIKRYRDDRAEWYVSEEIGVHSRRAASEQR
eukprot:3269384-Prymnesium_polylepis.1